MDGGEAWPLMRWMDEEIKTSTGSIVPKHQKKWRHDSGFDRVARAQKGGKRSVDPGLHEKTWRTGARRYSASIWTCSLCAHATLFSHRLCNVAGSSHHFDKRLRVALLQCKGLAQNRIHHGKTKRLFVYMTRKQSDLLILVPVICGKEEGGKEEGHLQEFVLCKMLSNDLSVFKNSIKSNGFKFQKILNHFFSHARNFKKFLACVLISELKVNKLLITRLYNNIYKTYYIFVGEENMLIKLYFNQ